MPNTTGQRLDATTPVRVVRPVRGLKIPCFFEFSEWEEWMDQDY